MNMLLFVYTLVSSFLERSNEHC